MTDLLTAIGLMWLLTQATDVAHGPTANDPAAAARAATWVISTQRDDVAADHGGALVAAWVRPLPGASTLALGLGSYRLGDSRWTVANVGGALRPTGRTTVDAELKLGSGERGSTAFDYRSLEAGITRALVPGRLFARLGDRYLDIDQTRGNLASLGLTAVGPGGWSAQLGIQRTTGGNFAWQTHSGRLDWRGRRLGLLVGFADGQATPALLELFADTPDQASLDQVFAGVVVTSGRLEWLAVFDRLRLGDTERTTVSLTCKITPRRPR